MSVALLEAMAKAMTTCPGLRGSDDKNTPPATPEELAELGARYLRKHEFKPGDLVQWKPGLCNSRYPKKGSASVVIEVIPGRSSTTKNAGANHCYEPNDIRVGVVVGGDFEGFWSDSNRFEPYRAPAPNPIPEDAVPTFVPKTELQPEDETAAAAY